MDLKPNVTSAPHDYWFYLNLIHASHCQKNFPNVYKTNGVTIQSKSCLMTLHSIFKVQVFVKVSFRIINLINMMYQLLVHK